jgi:hypothetical protein
MSHAVILGLRIIANALTDTGLVTRMYGPPRDCKGEVWSRRQVCANVFGLWVEISSPGHDELRACLSF